MQRQGRDALRLSKPLKTPKWRSKDRRFGVFSTSIKTEGKGSRTEGVVNRISSKCFKVVKSTMLRKGVVLATIALIVPGIVLFSAFKPSVPTATAAPSTYLNFQARLMASAGNLVPDGTYNVEFKMYNASSSSGSSQGSCSGDANCVWTETRVSGNKVNVVNGYLSVTLGSVTAFSGLDWSQQHWLTMNIGGTGSPGWDGEMTPRILLTAVPLAFVANNVASGGTNASSTNSSNVSIQSGNAAGATSNSGNITIDAGTATGTTGTISLGASNASSLILGRSGLTTLNAGNMTIQGGTATLGTTSQAGSLVVSDGSSSTITIKSATQAAATNYDLTIPAITANDTICLLTLGNCFGSGSGGTLQAAYDADVNGSDAVITLTSSDGAVVVRDASSTVGNLFVVEANGGTDYLAVSSTAIGLGLDTTLAAGKSLTVTGGNTASRPGSPAEGMIYYDTTTKQLLTYANGKWQGDRAAASRIVAASNSSQFAKDAADYVGDGETSSGSGVGTIDGDQVQINSALTAVSSAGGGTVYLMEGTYTVDASISIPNNVTLAGSGMSTIIQLGNFGGTATNISAIVNTDTATGTSIVIRDIKLIGRRSINTNGTQIGIDLDGMGDPTGGSGAEGARILNVTIEDFRTFGFNLTSSASTSGNNTYIGNSSKNNTYGYYFNFSENDTITGNLALGNTSAGFRISGDVHDTITGNVAQSNAVGFYIDTGSSFNTFTGNTAATNTTNGITIIGSSNYNSISSNNISDSGGSTANNGISLSASDNNSITDNLITDISCTTTCYGINITNSTSDNTYVANNRHTGTSANPSSINDAGTNTIYASQLTVAQVLQSGSSIIRATGTSVLTGTIDPTASTAVVGVGTKFLTQLQIGDRITVSTETRTVTAITDDLNLTVDTAFSNNGNDTTPDRLPASLRVVSSAGAAQLIVQDNGFVGIGTSAPTVALDVTGSGLFSGTLGIAGATTFGVASSATGTTIFRNASGSGGITLTPANPGSSNYTITIPAETGTVCTTATVCSGYGAASGSFVNLQGSTPGTPQTGHLNISGTGIFGGAVTVGTTLGVTGNATFSARLDATSTTTSTSGSNNIGSTYTVTPGSASTANYYAIGGSITSGSSNLTGGLLTGIYGSALYTGSGTLGDATGVNAGIFGVSGTITNARGVNIGNSVSGTITNNFGLYVAADSVIGTVTSNAGIAVANKTGSAGNNNTNLLLGTLTIPAGNWSIYNSSAYNNAIAGNLRVGSTVAPTVALDVTGAGLFSGTLGVSGLLSANLGLTVSGGSLTISGVTADITTVGNEDLTLSAAGSGDVTVTGDDNTEFGVGGTITNSGSLSTIGLVLGNDGGADAINGLAIAVISANTGDADTVNGIYVGNLLSADATVTENALKIGSSWDSQILFDDTTTQIQIVNTGVLTLEDDAGNDLLTVTDAGAAGNVVITGTLTVQGTSATFGTSGVAGSLIVSDGSSSTVTFKSATQVASTNYDITVPAITGSDTVCLVALNNCAGSGATSVGALDTPTTSADGGHISAGVLYLQSATASVPGLVNIGTQTFAGTKTFNGSVILAANQSLSITGGATGSRPGSPTEGMVFFDTTTKQLLTYANGKWQADRTDSVLVAASNSSQADKDIADYVADGNGGGANDGDQVQINSALTAGSGKKVVLLAGTYVADATILVPNNTTLTGVGLGTVIELADLDATDNLIENSDTSTGTGVTIRDMKLDGRDDLNTAGTQNGINFEEMGGAPGASSRQGGNILNMSIEDFRDAGIMIYSATAAGNNVVTGSVLRSNTNGIYTNLITNSTFSNNIAIGNVTGFRSLVDVYNTYTGNVSQSNTNGFIIESGSNATLTGNTMNGNTTYGINLINQDASTISGNNITATGGTTANNGIYLSTSDSNIITSNLITDTGCTTTCYGINISNSSSDNNYLADNRHTGTAANPSSINDAGTNTIYASQLTVAQVLQSGSSLIKATATSVLTGTIDPTASTAVVGVGTKFLTQLQIGDRITVSTETRTVTAITDNLNLTVNAAFSNNGNDTTPDRLPASLRVVDSAGAAQLIIQDNGFVGINNTAPGNQLSVNTATTADSLAQALISTGVNTNKGLVIQGVASQAANLQEWQNSAGTVLGIVNQVGGLIFSANVQSSFGTASPATSTILTVGTNSAGNVGLVIKGTSSQSADLMRFTDNNNLIHASFDTTGAQLTLGRIAASGVVTQGKLIVSDGTTDNFSLTLQSATLSGSSKTITFPNETGTVCTTATVCSGYGAASGSFVNLQGSTPGTQQTGNLNISGMGIFGGGITVTGAASSINASSNFATNINTGTSTGAVSIGNSAAGAIAIQSASTVGITGTTSITGLTSGVALTISNSTSVGNILNLQDNVTTVMSVADGGAVLFKNSVNSTAGFTIQASGGTPLFNVDTTNSVIKIAQDSWFAGVDSAGTGTVNILKVNANNEIQFGAALNVDGGIVFPTNAGQITFTDLPIDATASVGTKESYSFRVGSSNVLTVYGEADGSGNLQNGRVAVGSSITPAYTLDVGGTFGVSGATTFGVASSATGTTLFRNASGSGGITLTPANPSSTSYTITLPAETGTVCTTATVCSGYGAASGSFVNLQGSTPGTQQTGHLNISGTGIFGGGLAVTGATTSINASSNFATNINTGTSTGAVSIGNSLAGAITLQSGSGISLTANAASSFTTTTGALSLDSAAALNVGATNSTSVVIGNTANTATIDTYVASGGFLRVGSTGLAHTIRIGNNTGAVVETIQIGINGTASSETNITLGSSIGASATTINAGTGTLSLGNNSVANSIRIGNNNAAVNQTINIGVNANASAVNTVVLGSDTSSSVTTLHAGTGGLSLGNDSVANSIRIGNNNAAVNQTINIGNNANASAVNTVVLGSDTSSSTTTIKGGTGTGINIGNDSVANTIKIGNHNAAVAQTISIGNNANASANTTVNLGAVTGASSTNIQAGTGGLNLGNDSVANTIKIGNFSGAVNQTLYIGVNANASAVNTVTLGSTTSSSATTIQAGSGNITLQGTSVIFSGMTTDITTTGNEALIVTAAGTGDVGFLADDDTTISITGTVTNTGTAGSVGITLGNDGGADTVRGFNIVALSANTGDADILIGLAVDNLLSADATVTERAFQLGSAWDTQIYFDDTTTQIQVLNTGVITFEDDAGNDLLTVTDGGTVGNVVVTGTLGVTGVATLTDDLAVNGGDLTTSAATLNLFNANATTVNAFQAGTTISLGATSGTLTVRNANQTFGNAAGSGVFTNNGATVNTTLAVANDSDGGALGGTPGSPLTAAQSVDIYTGISINQTTASQTITLPSPTASTAYGRQLFISNIGTASFTILGSSIPTGSTANFVWSNTNGGASWQYAGVSGGSGSYIQNQSAADQTGDFRVTGTGRANTSFTSPLFDSITGTVSLGTSTATGVTIGGTTNTTDLTLQGAAAATYSIGTANGTGTITLGQSTSGTTQTINISSANATASTQTINVGAGTSTTSGGKVINIGTGTPGASTTNAIAIGNGGTTTGTVGITIGSVGAAAHTTLIQGGNGSTALQLQTASGGTLSVGNAGVAGTIQVGNTTGAVAQTINLGNNATASSTATVTLGSSISTSTTNIQSGSSGVNINDSVNSPTNINTGTSTGAVTIGNSAAGAIVIQNGSSGINLSTTGNVTIGTSDTTGTLLVLDTKTGTGDPTAVDGGMYYNSAIHSFRCSRDGSWSDCAINEIDHSYTFEDDFMGGAGTTAGPVGNVGWKAADSNECSAVTYNSQNAGLIGHDHPGVMENKTGGANTDMCVYGQNTSTTVIAADDVIKTTVSMTGTINNGIYRTGWTNQGTTAATRPTSGAYWEADSTNDTKWQYCYANNAAATCADNTNATPTIAANTWVKLEIRIVSSTAIDFIYNGTKISLTGITFDLGATNKLMPTMGCGARTAATYVCEIEYFQWRGVITTSGGR